MQTVWSRQFFGAAACWRRPMWRTGQRLPTKAMQLDQSHNGRRLEWRVRAWWARAVRRSAKTPLRRRDVTKPALRAPVGLEAGAGVVSTISNAAFWAMRWVRGPG